MDSNTYWLTTAVPEKLWTITFELIKRIKWGNRLDVHTITTGTTTTHHNTSSSSSRSKKKKNEEQERKSLGRARQPFLAHE
uniref:Uncharacterized protein n=1 Tax=Ditylenchus dipsaci TaxID=166011 RepID=A0A915CRZ3_9BILA